MAMRSGTQRGFIALFALMTLVALVGVVAFVMATAQGQIMAARRLGGEAQAARAAQEVLSRRLVQEHLQQPRWWIPPLTGADQLPDGTLVRWTRVPADARWRAGSRIWSPEDKIRLARMGARPERVDHWASWLEHRALARASSPVQYQDLVTDIRFLASVFRDLGLEDSGLTARSAWTTEDSGALGRINLLGADPILLSRQSGLSPARIESLQHALSQGLVDPAHAVGLLSYMEAQALEPWASVRPFSEARWQVEVQLPAIREPILIVWRSSLDDGTPGNPWFHLRPVAPGAW